ncbi:MAG: Hpt domain-containing protein [Candidatus Brocadia sp.]|nr:MAG: Hpt domain-containing protein [Candidatus Brocadia sp.]
MKTNSNDIADFRTEKWENDEIVFDKNEALEINANEVEFLKELAEMFIDGLPEQMSSIKEAVHSRDNNALEKSAHKLKGAVANFGNNTVFKAALNLEMMGRENRLEDVEEAYGALTKETARLVNALRNFIKSE